MTEMLELGYESSPVTEEVIKAHNASRKIVTKRVAIFEADGTTPWEPSKTARQAIEASVSVDGNRDERRTITLSLMNRDGTFDNTVDGFWYDKIIKAYRGLKYWSESEKKYKRFEYKLGEFMIDSIESDYGSPVVSVSGRDYSKKLMLDQFDEPTSFNEGSTVDDLVRTIALNAGIKRFKLNTGTTVINALAAFEAETSRWEAIREICKPYNIEVFFNNEGMLETRLFKDVTTAPVIDLVLNAGNDSGYPMNLISASQSSTDSNVFNAVRVYATAEQGSVTGARFVAVRENNDLSTPTCIQKIGRRPTTYSSDLFTSQQQVDEYADNFLKVSQLQDFSFSFDSVVYPWLEANSVIRVTERVNRNLVGPARYLLGEFTIPVGMGTMGGTGKRITQVGNVGGV